jgi:putative two-component system response regulator
MSHKILLVDDEPSVREVIGGLLKMLGYEPASAANGHAALEMLRQEQFSVLITDIHMPEMNGIELVERARRQDANIGIVVITGVGDLKIAIKVMQHGANEYLLKPVQFDALNVAIEKCLGHRRLQMELRAYQEELETKVSQRTEQLTSAHTALQTAHQDVKQAYLDLVTVLSKTAESNDSDTGHHIKRVSSYVSAIAKQLGHTEDEVSRLAQFSTTHDIGKVTIHPDILKKPGKLTYDEFEAMKLHTVNGATILSQSPTLDLASSIALSHHERHDGKGYPHGIGSEEIPVEARITSVADVFDALTMKRCYKEAWSIDKAVGKIEEERGKQFNPEVVDAFIGCLDHIRSIRQKFPE